MRSLRLRIAHWLMPSDVYVLDLRSLPAWAKSPPGTYDAPRITVTPRRDRTEVGAVIDKRGA